MAPSCLNFASGERRRVRLLLLCSVALAGLLATSPARASAKACTLGVDMPRVQDRDPSTCAHFPIPGTATGPIAPGPGNSLTFIMRDGGGLAAARMADGGAVTRVGLPVWAQDVYGLAPGPDGSHWFTAGALVGRIGPEGNVTAATALDATGGIVSGPDGAFWYAGKYLVGRITAGGQLGVFPTAGGTAGGITAGPDGALWYTAYNAIGRITTGGQVTKFPLPGGLVADGQIVAARDGTMWFTDRRDGKAGRITTGGAVDSVDLGYRPLAIAPGPDRTTVWMTLERPEGREYFVARMQIRSFPSGRQPGVGCDPKGGWSCKWDFKYEPLGTLTRLNALAPVEGITLGNDGRIYFTETNRIGRVLTYRGAVLCGRAPWTSDLVGASGYCGTTPRKRLTNSGAAYIHMTCPKFSLRYCAGTVEVRLPGASSSSPVGSGYFVLHTFDSPSARIVMSQRAIRLLKRRGSLRLWATIRTRDAGGLTATTSGSRAQAG